MTADHSVWWVIALAVLAANAPFLSQRWLLLGPRVAQGHKPLWARMGEWGLCYLLVGVVGMGLEQHLGQRHPQSWEFYAVTLSLFLTLAFPGFVYRYLARKG